MHSNNQIRILFFSLLLLVGSSISFAQKNQPFSKDDFLKKRADYLKRELALTPQEVAKFIPLSEEMMEKKFELNRQSHDKARAIRGRNDVSDREYEDVIDSWIENGVKEAALEKEYYQKFKQVLPMWKVRRFQEVDMKFVRSVMSQNER